MLVVISPKSKETNWNCYGITIYNYQAWGLTLKEAIWLGRYGVMTPKNVMFTCQ